VDGDIGLEFSPMQGFSKSVAAEISVTYWQIRCHLLNGDISLGALAYSGAVSNRNYEDGYLARAWSLR